MVRLLVPHAVEGELVIDGQRLHYLKRVLRLVAGDELEVFDGETQAFAARVLDVGDAQARLLLSAGRPAPQSRSITVVQGLPKGDKLELILQKSTELGAAAFMPAACTRCVVKLDGKEDAKRARWQRIVEEAARQSGRVDVPLVHAPQGLLSAAAALAPDTAMLVLDEEERALPLSHAVSAVGQRPLALIIGPEGGLTREEVAALVARGATAVTLGKLVLRTETAALAALAVLRHLDGQLG